MNAETVFTAVQEQLINDDVPFTNLVCFIRLCSIHERRENGFQSKLKTVAPQIIDIDGDVCHHIHIAVTFFK